MNKRFIVPGCEWYIHKKTFIQLAKNIYPVMYSANLGHRYTGLGTQTLAPRKQFAKFSFFSCISTKNTLKYV